jgi:hypothetical protein
MADQWMTRAQIHRQPDQTRQSGQTFSKSCKSASTDCLLRAANSQLMNSEADGQESMLPWVPTLANYQGCIKA